MMETVRSDRGRGVAVSRLNRVLVAAAIVAIPTMSACGAGGASNPCSAPNERGLQATMSGVETRAHVTSASAFAPTCGARNDPPGLTAQRVYRSGRGVEDAIKICLAPRRVDINPGAG